MAAVAEQKQIIKGGAFLIEERTPAEVFTPEDFTEEHRMIAETTRQFVDNEVSPHIDDLEKHDWKLARELIKKAADLGLIGAVHGPVERPLAIVVGEVRVGALFEKKFQRGGPGQLG